jgi:hypothetical protein
MAKLGKIATIALVLSMSLIALQPFSSDFVEAKELEDANLSLTIGIQDRYIAILWHADRSGTVEREGFLSWSGEGISVGDRLSIETSSHSKWELVPSFSFSSGLIEISLFKRDIEGLNFDPGISWRITEDSTLEAAERVVGLAMQLLNFFIPDIPDRIRSFEIFEGIASSLPNFDLPSKILADVVEFFSGLTDSIVGSFLALAMLLFYYPIFLFLFVSVDSPFSLFEEVMLSLFGFLAISFPLLAGLKVEGLSLYHEEDLGIDDIDVSFSRIGVAHLFSIEDFSLNIRADSFKHEGVLTSPIFEMGVDLAGGSDPEQSSKTIELRTGDRVIFAWSGLTFELDLAALFSIIERDKGKTTIEFGLTIFKGRGDLKVTLDLFP